MSGLPLSTRRAFARGFNKRHVALGFARRGFLRSQPKGATGTLGSGNSAVSFATQDWRGTAGNSIRVRIVVSGASTPLSVSVSGNDITINSATNGSSAATTTATQAAAAVNASGAARDLVLATAGGTGAGVVAAAGFTNLTGGTS